MHPKSKGFTLLELLVSISTIGIIASMLLPAITKVKNNAKDVCCISNHHAIHTNYETLIQDHFPDYRINRNQIYEIDEFYNDLTKECAGELTKDRDLDDLGIEFTRGLNCPFSLGNKEVRMPFHVFRYLDSKGIEKRVSGTYSGEIWNIGNSSYSWGNNSIVHSVIWDPFTSGREKERDFDIVIGYISREGYSEEKTVTLNRSLSHPHKGQGSMVTSTLGDTQWRRRLESPRW